MTTLQLSFYERGTNMNHILRTFRMQENMKYIVKIQRKQF